MKKQYYKIRICIDCGNEKKVLTTSQGIRCNSCSNRITSVGRHLIDISGDRYGKLIALERVGDTRKGTFWKCQCDCGNQSVHNLGHLTMGHSKSCGCLYRKLKGLSQTRTYKSYDNMIRRCYKPNLPHYKRYGGAGITVCERWKESYLNFLEDMGDRPEEMTLDRIDPAANYNKENCRWATPLQQGRNKRNNRLLTCKGITATLSEWSSKTGIDSETISYRINNGWAIEDALTLEVNPYTRDKKSLIHIR